MKQQFSHLLNYFLRGEIRNESEPLRVLRDTNPLSTARIDPLAAVQIDEFPYTTHRLNRRTTAQVWDTCEENPEL